MTRVYQNSKAKILESAKAIITKKGSSSLTIESVLKESGLSRAGFFYNFKNKEEMMVALVEESLLQFSRDIDKIAEKDPNPDYRTLRALVDFMKVKKLNVSKVLFDISVNDSKTFEMYKFHTEQMKKRILSESPDKGKAILILMAIDGFWYDSSFKYGFYPPSEIKAFFEQIDSMLQA